MLKNQCYNSNVDIYVEFWVILFLNSVYLTYYVVVYYKYKQIIHRGIRKLIHWFVSLTLFSLCCLVFIVVFTEPIHSDEESKSYYLFNQLKVLVLHLVQTGQ